MKPNGKLLHQDHKARIHFLYQSKRGASGEMWSWSKGVLLEPKPLERNFQFSLDHAKSCYNVEYFKCSVVLCSEADADILYEFYFLHFITDIALDQNSDAFVYLGTLPDSNSISKATAGFYVSKFTGYICFNFPTSLCLRT